ncbi:MAG: hypothetical protein P1P77_05280 [Spirochaetaceae bacterium]|nr:hypothetical protein [Spirochaetaceae bacterium]
MSDRAKKFYSLFRGIWKDLDRAGDEPAAIADAFLDALSGEEPTVPLPSPFKEAVGLLHSEFEEYGSERFLEIEQLLESGKPVEDTFVRTLWMVLFPEALHLNDDPEHQIPLLRRKRTITVDQPAAEPLTDTVKQVIFTSNVLLSPPMDSTGDAGDEDIVASAQRVSNEQQLYWYDHPIPVGTPLENDEAVYGLKGLSDTMRFEKSRGTSSADSRMTVLLSVSVTHEGLRDLAGPWLKRQLTKAGEEAVSDLDIYAFTEDDAASVLEILRPWFNGDSALNEVKQTFGVDGEYGRHYSFLKAMPALWSVLMDQEKRATFKIDLDQVFPQEELTAETGKSAFEHFQTPLWGALGRDEQGRPIELGMIAGGLVNEKDIGAGLFTPDIPWPTGIPEGEDLIFFKQRPMAVSTRAEIMTRYGTPGSPDGVSEALQRIHVTGGTNGILLDSLRKHRPFTPSFVGRAEDQAYILSVLNDNRHGRMLRYIHASGLLMRHDKEAFAGAAVKAGKLGSYVGDLVRMFVFSAYAGFLPGGGQAVKDDVDPFTGCFISKLPATLAMLRLTLHLLTLDGGSTDERTEMMSLAARRLSPWLENPEKMSRGLEDTWRREHRAWNAFYDALDGLEGSMARNDSSAVRAREAFEDLAAGCRISV